MVPRGTFAGSVASTLVMHPLDTVKTRLRVEAGGGTEDGKEGEEEVDGGGHGGFFGSVSSLHEVLAGNILKEGPPSAPYPGGVRGLPEVRPRLGAARPPCRQRGRR